MNAFIYLAFALLPLDNFPYMFGGAYKPVSLIFIVLYCVLKIPVLIRMKFQRKEIWIFIVLVSAVLISAILGLQNNYSFAGLQDAVVSLAAGIIIYLSFRIYVHSSEYRKDSFLTLFRWMFRGYWLAVIIGLLQLVYMYAFHSGALSSVIGFFVQRDSYVTAGRLHFTFSEPSYIGLHTNLLLFPAYLILKKYNYLTKSDKVLLWIFIPLSLLSLSIRYYLDLLFFVVVYVIVTSKPEKFLMLFMKFMMYLAAAAVLLNIVFVNNLFQLKSDHYYRILHIYEDPASITEDNSFSIRSTYSSLGFRSFLDKPWFGYGMGNYYYGFMHNLDHIPADTLEENEELRDAKYNLTLPQYNMYTRLLSEFGLLGIMLILLLLSLVRLSHKGNFPKLMVVLLLYSLLQFDSFAFIQVLFWVAILQSEEVSRLRIGKAESTENKRKMAKMHSGPWVQLRRSEHYPK
ncbi:MULTISPECIES: O-antigen ligase family protein [unclassified Paenibacillus]|uniref:O-antigen ligase family protein n=1 Tax=unclassified Paenibacillus TaxID=185978 RepID=UPI0030F4EDA5